MYTLEKDIFSKEFLGEEERFADIINGFFFHGEQVINPENITEMDTAINRLWRKMEWIKGTVFYRDLLRRVRLSVQCFIAGVEGQTVIDYTMPLRVMGYDIQGYEKQLKELKKKHKILKDLTGDEFLSGINKEDRLEPIVTIIIYFGEEEWDGPLDLHGMLELEGQPEELRAMIPNYPIHVLDVRRYAHIENFQTDLKVLFEFLRYAVDKKQLRTYIEKKKEENLILSGDTYDMIRLMADIPELEMLKEKYANEEGDIVMCRAWNELKEDWKEEGKEEGMRLVITVISLSREHLNDKEIALRCGISEDKVRDILGAVAA